MKNFFSLSYVILALGILSSPVTASSETSYCIKNQSAGTLYLWSGGETSTYIAEVGPTNHYTTLQASDFPLILSRCNNEEGPYNCDAAMTNTLSRSGCYTIYSGWSNGSAILYGDDLDCGTCRSL